MNTATKELPGLDHLTGRVVIQFRKRFIASHLIGTKYIDKLLVSEIREKTDAGIGLSRVQRG